MSRSKIQSEATQAIINNNYQGVVNVSMRVGKTKIVIDSLKKCPHKKILWATTSTKLRDVDIPNEFIKWKAKTIFKKVDIVCWQSLHKQHKKYDLIIL